MTSTAAPTTLALSLRLDRQLAWHEGESVRYAVAELRAEGADRRTEAPPFNMALAIDVSGSMSGAKIDAARRTALSVVAAMTPRDRLTLVSFSNRATTLLESTAMDEAGRAAAAAAIARLRTGGNTNLWEGWLLAAEGVAAGMAAEARASHRLLLLSDGQANEGVTSAAELARHTRGLLERGIVTSAVGIGDGYDEILLGGMAEAGGGRLHDAEHATEISEVVLGELMEGRAALLERTTLRFTVPATLRAALVGGWAHTVLPGAIEVLVGTLLPDTPVRVVFRLHCPAGEPGTAMLVGAAARGSTPDGEGLVEAGPVEATLTLARGGENTAQPRDVTASLAALTAWQAEVMRRAVVMNREGDRRGLKHVLEREVRWMERYGRGLPGAEPLLAELVLLLRRAEEEMDPRLSKEVYAAASMRSFAKPEHRAAPRASLADRLRRDTP
jgi:Ca-activated chloride channel family protein